MSTTSLLFPHGVYNYIHVLYFSCVDFLFTFSERTFLLDIHEIFKVDFRLQLDDEINWETTRDVYPVTFGYSKLYTILVVDH